MGKPYRTTNTTPPLAPRRCACGDMFQPKRDFQIYCSTRCRVRGYWDRHEVVKREVSK